MYIYGGYQAYYMLPLFRGKIQCEKQHKRKMFRFKTACVQNVNIAWV